MKAILTERPACRTCQFHKEFTHWCGPNSYKFKEPLIVCGLDPLIGCTYKRITNKEMKAILTRQSGVTAIIDVYPARQSIPTKVLESRILETFNSFEGVKSNPFISAKIIRK